MRRWLVLALVALMVCSGVAMAAPDGEGKIKVVLKRGNDVVEEEIIEVHPGSGEMVIELETESLFDGKDGNRIFRVFGDMGGLEVTEEMQKQILKSLHEHLPKEMIVEIKKAMKTAAPGGGMVFATPGAKGGACSMCGHKAKKVGTHEFTFRGGMMRPGKGPQFFFQQGPGKKHAVIAAKVQKKAGGHGDALIQAINALRNEIGALRREIAGMRKTHHETRAAPAPRAGGLRVRTRPSPPAAPAMGRVRLVQPKKAVVAPTVRMPAFELPEGVVLRVAQPKKGKALSFTTVRVAPAPTVEVRRHVDATLATKAPVSSRHEMDALKAEMAKMRTQMEVIMKRLIELSHRDR